MQEDETKITEEGVEIPELDIEDLTEDEKEEINGGLSTMASESITVRGSNVSYIGNRIKSKMDYVDHWVCISDPRVRNALIVTVYPGLGEKFTQVSIKRNTSRNDSGIATLLFRGHKQGGKSASCGYCVDVHYVK